MDPQDEIKTLKTIIRRYEKQVDQFKIQQDGDKLIKEAKNLRTELTSMKKKNKSINIEKERFERDFIKQSKQITTLQEAIKELQAKVLTTTAESRQAENKSDTDELERKYKLEVKNFKHEAMTLRNAAHQNEETIKTLNQQLETLTLKLKEKDRIIASFAIWKKSIVYSKNKRIDEHERLDSIRASLPVPVLSLIEHKSETQTTVRVKVSDINKIDDILKSLKERDGYRPDEALNLEERDLVLCLESKMGDIKMEIPVRKEGEYEFEMSNLSVGRRYNLTCYIKEQKNGVEGNSASFDVVSDVVPGIPNPNVYYDIPSDGIKFELTKTKLSVKSFNIYLYNSELQSHNLLQTIYATAEETQAYVFSPKSEGFFVFQVSQVNDIGESKMCSPLTFEIVYPQKPALEHVYRDKKGELVVKFAVNTENTVKLLVEAENVEKPRELNVEGASVLFHLKSITEVVTIRAKAQSKGGQVSDLVRLDVDPQKIACYPHAPSMTIKSPSSLLVFPSSQDAIPLVNAIQVRYKLNNTVLDLDPSTAISGVFLSDIPKSESVQVAVRYAIDGNWSLWSEYETAELASAISLPDSNLNLSRRADKNSANATTTRKHLGVNGTLDRSPSKRSVAPVDRRESGAASPKYVSTPNSSTNSLMAVRSVYSLAVVDTTSKSSRKDLKSSVNASQGKYNTQKERSQKSMSAVTSGKRIAPAASATYKTEKSHKHKENAK